MSKTSKLSDEQRFMEGAKLPVLLVKGII